MGGVCDIPCGRGQGMSYMCTDYTITVPSSGLSTLLLLLQQLCWADSITTATACSAVGISGLALLQSRVCRCRAVQRCPVDGRYDHILQGLPRWHNQLPIPGNFTGLLRP